MKQAIRLYDFSAVNAATVILAYLVMICLAAGVAGSVEAPLPYLIVTVLLVISFVALFWYFGGRAPVLTEQNVSRGKLTVPKEQTACEVFYNTRYREMSIRIYNSTKPDAGEIRVQATKRNLKVLQSWLGYPLEIPQKNARK